VERDGETFHVHPASATDDPGTVGEVALVLLTTKAYDLDAAVQAMRPLIGAETLVLPLLNGVDGAERIGAVLGAEHVLAGQTYLPAALTAPGVVRQAGGENRLVFGEPAGGIRPRTQALLQVLRQARIVADLSPDIRREAWRKLLWVNPNGGVCAVARAPMGPVLRDPHTRALYLACMGEVEALARRQGIGLGADAVAETMAIAEAAAPETRPSLLQDLERGKPLELEAIVGVVVRRGEALGVPTPVNRCVYAALKPHVGGRR
jgi:2-dehydropantoate 2-reductase